MAKVTSKKPSLLKSKTKLSFFKKASLKKTAEIGHVEPDIQQKEVKTSGLDFIIISCLFLIFFLCPLFFTGLAAQGMGFEKMILFYFLVLLGTVAFVAKGIIKGELRFKRTPLDLTILAVLIISIISTILSINQGVSLIGSYGNSAKGLAALVIFILFYYLLINNINSKRIKLLFWSLVSSFSLVVIFSLLQLLEIFILPVNFTKSAGFNPIGSLTSLSMFIIIVLPILVLATAQIKEINTKLKKFSLIIVKFLVGIVTLAGLVILTFLNGITFWSAAIAGIVIVLLFLLSKTVSITNNNLIIPVTVFFLLVIFLVLGNFNVMDMKFNKEISLPQEASWDIVKNSVKENPILGSGPSTFYYSFSKYKDIDFNNSELWNIRFANSSNFIFELVADVGVLGVLAVVFLILIALRTCYKSIVNPKTQDAQSILLGLLSSFIVILILSLMFPLNSSLIFISTLIIIFAVSVAINIKTEKLKEIKLAFHISYKRNISMALLFLAVSAGVITMFTIGTKIYLADIFARNSVLAETLDKKVEKMEKAIELAPYYDIYYINLANYYMASVNQEAASGADQGKMLNNLNQAIKYARLAADKSPEKATNHEFLALIYENASMYTSGGAIVWAKSLEDSYNKVIEIEPNNPIPYFRIAILNVARANAATDQDEKQKYFNEAINNYNKATEKKSDFAAAYYGKGIAYEKLQNIDEAIEQIKSAVNNSGNNIDYMFELGRLYFNRGVMNANVKEQAIKDVIQPDEKGDDSAEASDDEELSVESSQQYNTEVERNEDINIANQIFLNILQAEKSHANALYSLGLIYQAVGENDNTKAVIDQLLMLLDDSEQKNKVKQQFKDLY